MIKHICLLTAITWGVGCSQKPNTVLLSMPPDLTMPAIMPKCITNDAGFYFYTQDGDSWGASDKSCGDAIQDWRHTADNFYLKKEYKM